VAPDARAARGCVRAARAVGFATAKEAARWVKEQFGATYSPGGAYKFLRRLRLAVKVPRPMSDKAGPARQEAWKKGGFAKASPGRA